MATKQSIVDFLMDQLAEAGAVSARKMFGDYGVFLSGKMIAIIGNDRLFFKPTEQGRKLISSIIEEIPYPGAKPYFLIPEEHWDDREWLAELAKATASELPLPVKKRKKR